jgi:biopolymer transport protein ExbD
MSFPVSKGKNRRFRKGRSEKKFTSHKPQLTSMVDAVVLLLIFMLQSFSAEGDIITVSKNMQLPTSSAQKHPKLTVNVTVTNEIVMAEQTIVANVEDVLKSDDLEIPGLRSWLDERRTTTEKIAQYSTSTSFKGEVTISGDKRIRFRLLKKIMYTCGQAGFSSFQLAVAKKDG